MIDQIEKTLSRVAIPETPLADKSSKIQTLDTKIEVSKVSSNSEE